ncbi:radical SAM protein [Methylotuvimicrobium buryatense]|uniref:Radical SAM protein n=1 Tax=Methylotuvimicrobium buryatense TaxID=95641 RepID=A0A4P9UR76_METBY|nr:radical SAM protein [Methylotuvimicrobium buryatense]QCW83877.1 radical SAM protein [Methylotuvimicrobium buryatense]
MNRTQSYAPDLTALMGRRVIIYGAGKIGRRIQEALNWFGVSVDFFWDLRADTIGAELGGAPVCKPDFHALPESERGESGVIVTIFAENVAAQVRARLEKAGYTRVITERDFITRLLHGECASRRAEGQFQFDLETCHICPVVSDTRNRCDIFDDHVRQHFVQDLAPERPIELVIPSVGVLVSNKCTLTCVGCNHLRDHYVASDHVDIPAAQILADLKKFVNAVDLVNKIVLVGGESMLHPEIEAILEGIMTLPRVGVVHVITNGTVIPQSERVFELLASPRVIVEISGYGEHIPVKFQRNVDKFIGRLQARGVHHRYTQTLQWFDFGGFDARGYSESELEQVYGTCCFVSNDIFDGRLFKCSRSAYGTLIGKIPDYPGDYVDIRNLPVAEVRRQVSAFLEMKWARVCNHCNGASIHVIEAGQQVKIVSKNQPKAIKDAQHGAIHTESQKTVV